MSGLAPPGRVPRARSGTRRVRVRRGWHRLRSWLPTTLGLGLLGVSVWVLSDVMAQFRFADLWAEIRTIGYTDLWWSLGFTVLSFSALVGYEHFAMAFAQRRVGFWTTTLGAFVAQAIAHTTGFAAVVATSLRYRIYAPKGLDLVDVAKVQAFFVFTFCLGLATLSGAVLIVEPQFPARLVPLPLWIWRLGGVAALTAVLIYLAWSARTRHPLRIAGQQILPPRPGVTVCQIALAFVDLGAGAAALLILLP
jgi:uncharacterized membrane protein YbhN (UPF0104 family)